MAKQAFYASRISAHRARTPEGYLVVLGVPVARTGWQEYHASEIDVDPVEGSNGKVQVYRSPEQVFSPATVASFEGKTVVSPHPPVFLTANDDLGYNRGHVQNVRKGDKALDDGEWPLLADLVIKDSTLISHIESDTLKEISCGYNCDYYPMNPDNPTSDTYKQVNIRGNHIAIVRSGRAGSSVQILDSKPEDEGVADMAGEAATVAAAGSTSPVPVVAGTSAISIGDLEKLGNFFKTLFGLGTKTVDAAITTTDSDPGAVERNEQVNKEALRRAKVRNQDDDGGDNRRRARVGSGDDRRRTRDADDDPPFKKKDDDDEDDKDKDGGSESEDAVDTADARMHDCSDCTHSKHVAHDTDDADLIPVETLGGDEIPKNPIPGADKALDALRMARSVIAQSGNQRAIDAYNDAVNQLKGRSTATQDRRDNGGYARLERRNKPQDVRDQEDRAAREGRLTRDSDDGVESDADASADFVATAKKFHRQNPGAVK